VRLKNLAQGTKLAVKISESVINLGFCTLNTSQHMIYHERR
jgi:hypothetical protein